MGPVLLIMFVIPPGRKMALTKIFFIMPLKKLQNKVYELVLRQFCRWITFNGH